MAKELIATLITNDNGEAFYTYTGTGAGETTFTAESGDLESEPLVINDMSEELTLTSDKNILSYVDNDTATLTATYEGETLEGKSVVFKLGSRILDTVLTDSEGVAEYEYSSQGMGDIVFTAECGELQETYELEDCIKYIASGSYTFSSSSMTFQQLCDTGVIGDCEISTKLKSANTKGFALEYRKDNDVDNNNRVRIGVGGDNKLLASVISNGVEDLNYEGSTYSANSDVTCKIVCENNSIKGTIANSTYTMRDISDLRYVGINNWNNAKTVTYTDLKIKPLPFNGTMSVSVSKDILSYADKESCTLTAALTGDNVGNRPVIFKNGDIVLDTVNTDSNGIATYTYNSQGIGDVTITAECINLQETYELEDCGFYDSLTSNAKFSHYVPSTSGAIANINEYSENGWKVGYGSSYSHYVCDYTPQTPYEVSYEVKDKGSNYDVGVWVAVGSLVNFMSGNNSIQIRTSSYSSHSVSVIGKWTIKVYSDKYEVYRNGVFIGDRTHSNISPSIEIECGGQSARWIQLKDLKIRPLPFNGSMSVSTNKDILSYADNDSCTLTATLTGDNVANRQVVFKNGNTVLDTVNTDSNGVATYTYSSQGAGDVTITVECINLQETCEIEDCIKYDTHTYTTQSNVILQSLPLEYECSFILRTNGSQSQNTAIISSDINGGELYVGKTGSTATYITLYPTSATSQAKNFPNGSLSNNVDNEFNWKYKNGEHILSDTKGNNVTLSGFTPSNLKCSSTSNCTIKNIKVKPLLFNGSMSVSASKDILSYADEEECVLTATLTGDNVANRPVVFKNGNTVLDTVNTNSNGVATYTYSSQGSGDVTITVECMNLQETFVIEDTNLYDTMTSASGHWTFESAMGVSYSSDGATINANGWNNNAVQLDTTIASSHSVEFNINSLTNTFYFNFQENGTDVFTGQIATDNSVWGGQTYNGKGSTGHYKISISSNKVEVYRNDELLRTSNTSLNTTNLVIYGGPSRSMRIKDFKIKPLPEQDEDTPLPTILYSNDGTITDLQRPEGGNCTTNGEHLILGDAYKKRFMLPITLNGDWEFSFNIITRIGSAFNLIVDNVEIADGNSYDAGTVIKLVCEQGTVKEYVNDTLKNSNTISSSNYSIGIKPIVNSFYLDNLQVKQLEE